MAFLGQQYLAQVAGKKYFIDILLFHRHLRCLIAVELKIGQFRHEHVGQMQTYLEILDRHDRSETENPSIGIILCKEKHRKAVECSLRGSSKPICVATYKTSRSISKEIHDELPSDDEITRRLESLK